MVFFDENGKKYSGSGVLIIEDYYKKNGKIEPCIILVRNKASGEYTEFGGYYEKKHGSLEKTAVTELREESCNLFDINTKYLDDHIDIMANKNTFYRTYLIKINGVSRKYYLRNVKLIESLYRKGIKISHAWKETNDMVHIPIKNINFKKLGERGKIILKDIEGRDIIIRSRIKKVLYSIQSIIYDLVKSKSIAKRKEMKLIKSNDIMNGFYSFIIR